MIDSVRESMLEGRWQHSCGGGGKVDRCGI